MRCKTPASRPATFAVNKRGEEKPRIAHSAENPRPEATEKPSMATIGDGAWAGVYALQDTRIAPRPHRAAQARKEKPRLLKSPLATCPDHPPHCAPTRKRLLASRHLNEWREAKSRFRAGRVVGSVFVASASVAAPAWPRLAS